MKINNTSILITGGTGTFGKAMVSKLLKSYPNIKRLVIFSRDELKQDQMNDEFPKEKYKNLRYFIGDVRDYQRLLRALDGIDIIIHAAALKQVPAAEYNPIEFIKTNVLGAQNIIEAAIEKKVNLNEAKIGFSLYATQMENVISFADKKLNMPPKSTWFDPKPLDGLVAYDFE